MNATLRTTLGWVAAVLVNVGALLFVIGIRLPGAGGGVSVLTVGIVLCILGLVGGLAWLIGGRAR